MFTGIITDIGRVVAVEEGRAARRFVIDSRYDPASIDIGASIAHSGCCLTVVERAALDQGCRHVVEVSEETLARTILGRWAEGSRVNLERPLRVGDELGGHFVAGHVDGVATVEARDPLKGSVRLRFKVPRPLARFVAEKGSVAVDGVSLTVNGVDRGSFEVTVIPHTLDATTLAWLAVGDPVNIEVDMLARYLARLEATARAEPTIEEEAV